MGRSGSGGRPRWQSPSIGQTAAHLPRDALAPRACHEGAGSSKTATERAHRRAALTLREPHDYREMRVKRLEDMCSGIQRVLGTDAARGQATTRCLGDAHVLARRFPLTHRARGAALENILADGRLRAKEPCTTREAECGVDRALYFFLGCAAYPEGPVAFLASGRVLDRMTASYSPFDSGSLSKFARPRDPLAPWGEPEKRAFLASYFGDGTDAVAFSAEYVAAHFETATDYVLRPQTSTPDYPTYHGLESTSGDRRAWSIEVRLHEDLPLDPAHVEAVVIGQADLLADLPDDLAATVIVAEDEAEVVWMIQRHILHEATP